MNIKSVLALVALVVSVTGCSSMKTTSEAAPNHAFSLIKTYQWIDGPADILDDADTYINEDIGRAIDAELVQRGFRAVPNEEEADMQIAYYVKLKEDYEYTESNTQERDFSGGFVYSREDKNWSYAEREPDLNVYIVEIGTLTVLAYDAQTGQRIWRGTLKTKIERSRPQEQQIDRIRTAAKKLIDSFPSTP